MTKSEWNKFTKARERFRSETEELSRALPKLKKIQQELVSGRSGGKNSFYTVETPVVYNSALDEITSDDEIKLILVADNPGRREQAAENRRYLSGPSGKIARKFFIDNPELGIDFQKNAIILNKTPVHSPRTAELRELCRIEAKDSRNKSSIASAIENSQKTMALLLLEFHEALGVPVWITGYSEMKKGGIFECYTETLKSLYAQTPGREYMYKQIFFYRHFSMNQFTIDLKQQALPAENIAESLARIGAAYRERILGK
ncbi:MAG: hypothetical protein FWC03_06915 [Treponema sp.]|nr:hypothetical protein [Treponema sp.]